MAAPRDLVGVEITEYTTLQAETREMATRRTVEQAESMGSDAVVSVRYTTSMITSGAIRNSHLRHGPKTQLAAVRSLHVTLDHVDKVGRYLRTRQELHAFSVNEHGRTRIFTGARQRDANVGGPGFAGTIHHAAHDSHLK